MEIFILLFFAVALYAVILKFKNRTRKVSRDKTELWVEAELQKLLSTKGYVIFGDLIIPSISKQVCSTQIDHVIISLYGIFCLETKSHKGSIYGNYKAKYWKQYFWSGRHYEFYNPIRQNKHHVRSLEYLLRSRLKSPIHSYVVFPSAHRIKVNGAEVDFSLQATIDRILRHTRIVYTLEDVQAMAKGLAYASTRSSDYQQMHVESVRDYIAKNAGM